MITVIIIELIVVMILVIGVHHLNRKAAVKKYETILQYQTKQNLELSPIGKFAFDLVRLMLTDGFNVYETDKYEIGIQVIDDKIIVRKNRGEKVLRLQIYNVKDYVAGKSLNVYNLSKDIYYDFEMNNKEIDTEEDD